MKGGKIAAEEAKEKIMADTMAVVAKEPVKNAYEFFYENTAIGQALNKYAVNPFKSYGLATGVASGIGEVTGIAALAGTTGVPVAGVAAIEALGKYTGEAWAEMKTTGADWTTEDNYTKGLAYGEANAAWEGAQYLLGDWLNKLPNKSLSSSARNVLIDTVANALDTPYRATTGLIINDKDYAENFEEQGGWGSVLASIGVGLIGSIAGEVNSNRKSIPKQPESDIDLYLSGSKGEVDVLDPKSNLSAEEKIEVTREILFKFFDDTEVTLPDGTKAKRSDIVSHDKINQALNGDRVVICKTDAEFDTIYETKSDGIVPKLVTAFHTISDGKTYLRPDTSIETTVHETMHELGGIFKR